MKLADLINSPIVREMLEEIDNKKALEWALETSIGPSFTKLELSRMTPDKLKRLAKIQRERIARNRLLANCIELSEKMDVEKELYRRKGRPENLKRFLYFRKHRERNLSSLRKVYREKMKTYASALRAFEGLK